MSDELDIEAIEARLNAATPGPWCAEMDADKKATARDWREVWAGPNAVVVADGYERHSAGETETVYGVRIRAANADLIAHAPEDLRALLAEVRRLTEHADQINRERNGLRVTLDTIAHWVGAPEGATLMQIRDAMRDRDATLLADGEREVRDDLARMTEERDRWREYCEGARESVATLTRERDAARNALAAVRAVVGSGS